MTKVRKYLVPMLAIVLGGFSAHAEALDGSKFTCMVQFTAFGYDGESTLENFPALVRLSEGIPGFHYSDIGDTTNAVYASLRFADADYNNLDYEIETWDTNGTSFVWVSIPELSGTGTKFFACYMPDGGYTLPDVYPTNVWTSAGYVGVWHLSVTVNGRSCYKDSSGGGADLFGSWNFSSRADSSCNANGTPWSADGARAVTTNTAGWTFSRTGYSVESWISTRERPGYNEEGNAKNGYMFASEAKTDNGAEKQWAPSNGLQVYPTYATIIGGLTNTTVVTSNPVWHGDATNDWHFISAVWKPEGSTEPATLYEAGVGYSSHGTNLRILRTVDRRAIDFDGDRGMGVFASSDRQGNGCWYDETRVRRSVSTPDWIQANWDTQRVGTDFLTAGEVKCRKAGLIIFVR